jgi:hypothetical protein
MATTRKQHRSPVSPSSVTRANPALPQIFSDVPEGSRHVTGTDRRARLPISCGRTRAAVSSSDGPTLIYEFAALA